MKWPCKILQNFIKYKPFISNNFIVIQVADERFLVLINNLLASGEIPDLFSDDEVENIVTMVRNEVKGAGLQDTRENCWKFFIDRVRRQLKVILCFSPVGNTLRVRGRKFPAVISCTCIDWFHEWPQEALISVSMRFLSNYEKNYEWEFSIWFYSNFCFQMNAK